jgi:phage/plasmid-like protein (TIGR03299 family)
MYTNTNPMRQTETHDTTHGTTAVSTVDALGSDQYFPGAKRLPAFIALAAEHGGWTAENTDGMTLEEATRLGRLDFTVTREPFTSTVPGPDGEPITVGYKSEGMVAHWPDGTKTGLGTATTRYKIVQPADALDLGNVIMDDGGANVVATGLWGNPIGQKTYAAFKLPNGMTVGGVDRHDLYLTIINSYEADGALKVLLAPIRLDCTNQGAATFGQYANRFSIRHSGDIATKITEARHVLKLAGTWTEHFRKACEKLLTIKVDEKNIIEFLEKAVPTPKSGNERKQEQNEANWSGKRLEIKQVITTSATNEFGRDTALGWYNGLVEWLDYGRPAATEWSRYTRTLDGRGDGYKQAAMDLLLAA